MVDTLVLAQVRQPVERERDIATPREVDAQAAGLRVDRVHRALEDRRRPVHVRAPEAGAAAEDQASLGIDVSLTGSVATM